MIASRIKIALPLILGLLASVDANAQVADTRDASFLPPPNTAFPNTAPLPPASTAPAPVLPATASPTPATAAPTAPAVPTPPVERPKSIEHEPLSDVNPDTMGLLSPDMGGLGTSVWENTPRAFVERLLTELSLPTSSPTLNSLARRLFLSPAAVPPGETAVKRSFTDLRLEKLLALGDVTEAWQMAILAKPGHINEETMRAITEASIIGPDSKALCEKMPEIIAGRKGVEWQKSLVICQLRAKDLNAAQLGLDIMREQNVKDDIFTSLANNIFLGNAKPLPRQLTPLKPLTLALLLQTEKPLPQELYARPDAFLIVELLKAKPANEVARLTLAERAAARGLINAKQLAALYEAVEFDSEDITTALISKETGPRLHALLYQAVVQEKSTIKSAELINKFLGTLDAPSATGVVGQLIAEQVDHLPQSSDSNFFSVTAARVFALVGRPDKAMPWLKIARGPASRLPTIKEQMQESWPLFVLAGLISDSEYAQELKNWMNAALQDATPARRQQVESLLLLFSASGFAIPDSAWLQLGDVAQSNKRQAMPSPLLLERLHNAGLANRRGEATLLSLILAGGNDVPLFVTTDVVKALRQVGLTAEAQALAREAAVSLLAEEKK